MVSPLKTWHHQEPKGLWPALGSLALLTHVGVLGLSLPYVLKIMEPSGTSATATIPIELIEVDSAVAPSESLAESKTSLSTPAESSPEPVPQSPVRPTSRPPRVQSSEPAISSSSDSAPTSPTNSAPISQAPQPEDINLNNETSTEQNVAPQETPSAGASDSSGTDSDPGKPAEPEPATLPSEGPALPTPDELAEEESEQIAYLNLVSHSHIPDSALLTDLADTPATPTYEEITGIQLSAQNVGCGRVDFSRSQVTYRVEVSPQGTLRSAVPWTGGIEPYSMNEEEKTISCLIVAAGFQFNPAIKDGAPVANSNLLLTIDLIESGLD